MQKILRQITGWLLVLSAIVLPLKFGSLALMPEQASMFPQDLLTAWFITWPPHGFGLWGALLLMLALLSFPVPDFRNRGGISALLWGVGLPLAALGGAVNATVAEWPEAYIGFYLGSGAFALAGFWVFSAESVWKRRFLAAALCGAIWVGAEAFHQYFWGFKEMEELMERQIAAGAKISVPMQIRIRDARIFSTLGSCNTLAGFLLLLTAPVLALLWQWGKKFTPVKVSQILFLTIGIIFVPAVLLLTRSRGAFLCAAAAAGIWFLTLKVSKIWKIAAVAAGIGLIGCGAYFIHRSGRGFLSISERFDYMRTAAVMMVEHPFAGGGWGEFYHRHMKIKVTDSDESARDPHNIVLLFGSQAGIPAGVVALCAVLSVLALVFGRRVDDPVSRAGRWSLAAFALHCGMELNTSIPALVSLFPLLGLAMAPDEERRSLRRGTAAALWIAALIIAAGAGYASYRYLKAEYALGELEKLVNPGDPAMGGKVPPSVEDVMAAVKKADAQRSGSPAVLELGGDALLGLGEKAGAKELYLQALARDRQRPGLFRRLSELAETPEEAVEYMQKAHELFPANPKYIRRKAD